MKKTFIYYSVILLTLLKQTYANDKAIPEYVTFNFSGHVYGNLTTLPCPEELNITCKVNMKRHEYYWDIISNTWVYSHTIDLQPVLRTVKQNTTTGYYSTSITVRQYEEIDTLEPNGHSGIYKWVYYAAGATTVLPTQLGWYSVNGAIQNAITNLFWYVERTNGIHWRYEKQLAQKFSPCLILPGIDPANSNTNDYGVAPKPVNIMKLFCRCYADESEVYEIPANMIFQAYNNGTVLIGDAEGNPVFPTTVTNDISFLNTPEESSSNYLMIVPVDQVQPWGSLLDPGMYILYFHWEYASPSNDGCGTYDQPHGWYSAYQNGLVGYCEPGNNYNNTVYSTLWLQNSKPVIQYWFFYPFNNGINDHEGDWEHIDVVLNSADINNARIERIVYYFHENFLIRTRPSSSFPDNYDFFTIDETHPVVFVGGYGRHESSGIVGEGSGSHGSYPILGYWPSISRPIVWGTCHETIYNQTLENRNLHYNELNIILLKDVNDYDYTATPDFSWLKANIHWGHMFVNSPGAGTPAAWTDIGNEAPRGPVYQGTWKNTPEIGQSSIGSGNHIKTLYVFDAPPINSSIWQPPIAWTIPRWYIESYGDDYNATVSLTDEPSGGVDLRVNNNGGPTPGVQSAVIARKGITEVPITPNLRVNWSLLDRGYFAFFVLVIRCADGVDRELVYAPNAPNWSYGIPGGLVGWVNIYNWQEGSALPEIYNTWRPFSRNIKDDFLSQYTQTPIAVKALRLGYMSFSGETGDKGCIIKDIVFTEEPLHVFATGFENTDYATFVDLIAYKDDNTTPYVACVTGVDGSISPHTGDKMYRVFGSDNDNTSSNGYCYWKLYELPIQVTGRKYLSFWRYLDASPGNTGRIFLDGLVSQSTINTHMRDLPGVRPWDQFGVSVHPTEARPDAPGWKQYIINLSPISGQRLDNILLAYDDGLNESGEFNAYIDDIQLLDSYPNKDQWYVYEYGSVRNAYIRWLPASGGGAQLIMDNNGPGSGPAQWTDPYPWVQKDLSTPVTIPFDRTVTWSQFDLAHSLHFALLISCGDGQDRWLIYSANAPNHWPNQGWVDMGAGAGGYNVEKTFSRRVKYDFQVEYPNITPVTIKALRIGHFSDATWDGNKGGTVKDIQFRRGLVHSLEVAVKSSEALAYNNANKLALSPDGAVHLCYTGRDSVYYVKSSDKGATWATPQAVGQGQYPTISVDGKVNPVIAWVRQWTPETGGGILVSRHNGESWTPPETLAYTLGASLDFLSGYSPPSMTIRNDTVSLVYELAERGGIPPIIRKTWRLYHARFPVEKPGAAYTVLVDSFSSGYQPPWENPTSASIATDEKGNDHIAWHLEGSVYYAMRSIGGQYSGKVRLSGGGARNPFIAVNGAASVVFEQPYGWAGQTLYDVYLSTGYDHLWCSPVNMTNNQGGLGPTVCGTEVMWTGNADILSSSYDTGKMAFAEADNISYSDPVSLTPHAVKRQTAEGTETYRVWTEEVVPDSLWSLMFYADVKAPEPLYALDAGGETPSVFTIERDGYIDYNQKTKSSGGEARNASKAGYLPYKSVDYDSNALVYRFFSFDPRKKYNLHISFYQETGQDIKMRPYGSQVAMGEVNLPSGQEVVLEKNLPAACYKDGEILLEIRRHKGPFAVCGKILIYEDVPGGKTGGVQAAQVLMPGPVYVNALYQNYPNPMRDMTSIHYQLKKPGKVAIKVYNTLGQAVRTLVDGEKPAGYHQAVWDGRNDQGRKASSGVYFYNIISGEFRDIKKMTILK